MGIRDWFKKKDNETQSKEIEGAWKFTQGNTHLTIRDFTDTGVSYGDLVDGATPMKLYTFKMYKQDSNAFGEAGLLGKEYETVAFEAPASWDISDAINNGMLTTLLNQTNAINRSYNEGRQIDVLGRFDSNSNFTYSNPGIQDYIDNTYVPELNERAEQQRIANEKRRQKEEDPGLIVKALGKTLDFFGGIKEKIGAIRQKRLPAGQEEYAIQNETENLNYSNTTENDLTANRIEIAGDKAFRIGNTRNGLITAISIIGDPQILTDGSYLYTANKQLVNSFQTALELNCLPNCQFSLPIPPDQINNFLMGCRSPENPYSRANVDALMNLLSKDPLEGRGLYRGGLFFGSDRNLYYDKFEHLRESINMLNGNDNPYKQHYQQPQQTYEYDK